MPGALERLAPGGETGEWRGQVLDRGEYAEEGEVLARRPAGGGEHGG
jgi:hypothetical protein